MTGMTPTPRSNEEIEWRYQRIKSERRKEWLLNLSLTMLVFGAAAAGGESAHKAGGDLNDVLAAVDGSLIGAGMLVGAVVNAIEHGPDVVRLFTAPSYQKKSPRRGLITLGLNG